MAYIRACASWFLPDVGVEEARAKFREIRSRQPDRMLHFRCARSIPPVLVHVGELKGLIYASDRDGGISRTFIHFMERPPALACNPCGDQLYIVGGRYRVTRRGIEG